MALTNALSLAHIEESILTILTDFSEEQQKMISLLLYSIKRGNISTDDLGIMVVDALSNKLNKSLNTVDEYKAEFDRLRQHNLNTVISNNQEWEYGGLKTLEIMLLKIALEYHHKSCVIQDSCVISSRAIIRVATDTFGGPRKLYWGYIEKWDELGLIGYGTSINFWWFDFNKFKEPSLARYKKILEEEN